MDERRNPLTADDVHEQERLERVALLASFLKMQCREAGLNDSETQEMIAAWAVDWWGRD